MNNFFAIFLGLFVGVISGFFLRNGGFEFGLSEKRAQEIADRLQEEGYVFNPRFFGNSFEGIVKSVRGNQLTVLLFQPSITNAILGRDDVRTVATEGAEFLLRANLTPEEVEVESRRFTRALEAEAVNFAQPPALFKEVAAALTDITEGSAIIIESREGIGKNNQITALRIIILSAL